MLVSDAPQRAALLQCKAPGPYTYKPCASCHVTQEGDDGGELGDHRNLSPLRSRDEILRGLEELAGMRAGSTDEAQKSRELGVKMEDPKAPTSWIKTLRSSGEPTRIAPPEILHVDALVGIKLPNSTRTPDPSRPDTHAIH